MTYYDFIRSRGLTKMAKVITYATECVIDGELNYHKLLADEYTTSVDDAIADAKNWLRMEMEVNERCEKN